MKIKANEIKSETIQEAIREIEEKYGITGDKAEAIASHIVYTDEDWTDEESEETEKEIVPLEKFVKIASEFDNANYYTDKGWTIPNGTGPSDEAYGKALMQDYLDSEYQTLQEWENHLDNSLTESNEYYDMWEELFTEGEEEPKEDIKKYSYTIEKDENGYFGNCDQLDGCFAQGNTKEELRKNMEDVITLHLEDRGITSETIHFEEIMCDVESVIVSEGTIEKN